MSCILIIGTYPRIYASVRKTYQEENMKSLSKLASAVVLLTLMLSAFPAMGVSTAHAATCDWAQFIADVTVPDGTTYVPGATFQKT